MTTFTKKYPVDEEMKAAQIVFTLKERIKIDGEWKEETVYYAVSKTLYQFVTAYKESKKIRTLLIQKIEERYGGVGAYESVQELRTFIELNKPIWLVEIMHRQGLISVDGFIAYVKAETDQGMRLPMFTDELKHN